MGHQTAGFCVQSGCNTIHLRAYTAAKVFPGLYLDLVKKGRDGRGEAKKRIVKEIRGRREVGKKGEEEARGKKREGNEGEGEERDREEGDVNVPQY